MNGASLNPEEVAEIVADSCRSVPARVIEPMRAAGRISPAA
jgi:hypothetical protein